MRWRILGLLFLARIGLGFQFQTMASVGDDLVLAFGFSYAEIGVLIGLFMAPGLFLALPAGVSGRFASDRLLAVGGLAALSLGGLISGLAPPEWVLGAGRLLAGAGFLFCNLYFTKMIADWFDGREIATAMSILVMSWPFGIAMGQVGHIWLAAQYGWPAAFLTASAYCAVAALAVLVFYRPPNDLPKAAPGASVALSGAEWKLVFCAGAAWALFNGGYVVYLTFGPKMLQEHGLSSLSAAGIISIGSWLMIFSGAACGMIADRFGRRDLILTVCMTACFAGLLLLSVPGAGLTASLLFGILGMAPAGVIMSMAGQAMPPHKRAFGMGIFFTVYFAMMTLAPPAAGALFDASGSAFSPLVLGAILFASVVPMALMFRRVRTGAKAPGVTSCAECPWPDPQARRAASRRRSG